MALPIFAATLIGGIVAGITQFVASRIGSVLVGLGLTLVAYKGMSTLVGLIVGDINSVMSGISGYGGGSGGLDLGAKMLAFAAFAGLFEGINIVISGYMAYSSLMAMRVVLRRLS